MTKDELLRALLVERYTNPWWKTPEPVITDDDLACARRRREMVADFEALAVPEREAT
jgi:hypothetical protein